MKTVFVVLSIMLIAVSLVFSQESMQVPEQVKLLYSFEGTWEGDASITMGNEVNKGTASYVWSKIADGWGMLVDERVDIPAMGNVYIGHNIIGFHTGEGKYHLYTIDNFGNTHDHVGKMTDDKTMYLEYIGLTPDGKEYKEKLYMKIISPTECTLSAEALVNGKTEFTINTNMKKTK